KAKFSSRFAIHGSLTRGSAVRVHDDESIAHSYAFRQAVPNMRRKGLEAQLRTYVDAYFPRTFGDGDASLDTWISDLDRAIDTVLDNGPDNFGNTLMSVDVSAPSRLTAAWTKAPVSAKADAYFRMSIAVQVQLKRLIP